MVSEFTKRYQERRKELMEAANNNSSTKKSETSNSQKSSKGVSEFTQAYLKRRAELEAEGKTSKNAGRDKSKESPSGLFLDNMRNTKPQSATLTATEMVRRAAAEREAQMAQGPMGGYDTVTPYKPDRIQSSTTSEGRSTGGFVGDPGEKKNASVGTIVGNTIGAGLITFPRGIASTLDLLPTEKLFGEENDPFSWLNEYYTKEQEAWDRQLADSISDRGKGWEIGTTIGKGLLSALPDLALAYATGGGSVAAKGLASGAAKVAKGTTAASRLASAAGTGIKEMAKNPLYWTSMAQTLGLDYEEAKANGATDEEALATAFLTSAFNSGVEISGGFETLPKAFKKGNSKAILQWLKTSVEEGREEVVQSIISELAEKAIYDRDKEYFSLTNEDAVIDPSLATDFGMGFAVGGILGGASIGGISAYNAGVNAYNRRFTNQQPPSTLGQAAAELAAERNAVTQQQTAPQTVTNPVTVQTAAEVPKTAQERRNVQNNQMVNASNSVAPTPAPATVASVAKAFNYGERGTEAFQRIVENGVDDVEQVRATFQRAYEDGFSEVPREHARLTNSIQQMAYDAGRQDAVMSLKKYTEAPVTIYGKESGFVQNEVSSKNLSADKVALYDQLGKALGTKIVMKEQVYGGLANGSYKDGVVTIAADASNSYLTVLKHEITHRMQKLAPEKYTAFRNHAVQVMSSKRANTTLVEAYQDRAARSGVSLSTEEAMDEIAADFTELILTDENALRDFVNESNKSESSRSMAEKFFEAVREFVQKIKRAFKGDKAKMDAAAQKEFGATVEQLERAEQLWKEAYKAAAETVKAKAETKKAPQTKGESVSDVKYDLKGNSFQEDKYFARKMDQWNELPDGARVKVGTVQEGSALERVGLPTSDMYFDVGKIRKSMNDHDDHLSPTVLKGIPDMLNDPIVIVEYKGPKGNIKNTVNVYGNLFVGNTPVVVGIVMRLDSNGRNIINNIRTVHARSNFAKQITDESVLYLNEDKKKTRKWFHDCGNLNVPLAGTQFGLIRSIAFEEENVKFSLKDKDYLSAVERNDMATVQKMVDEAAEGAMPDSKIRDKSGKLMPVYHGTYNSFTVFDTSIAGGKNGTAEGFGIYTTDNPEVTEAYGNRQLKMYANITKPATSTKKTINATVLAKLIKETCKKQANDMVADGEYDNVKDALFDTWISNYTYTYGSGIEQAYRDVANTILKVSSNDIDIVQEVMTGMGIRDYVDAMSFYNDILTPITGVDGFWTEWEDANTGKKSNIILAFDSSQLKSADPVTRDDNGDVIPLSERFNKDDQDIRFSLKDGVANGENFRDNKEYNLIDSEGNTLTKAQQEYFKDSKVRDAEGNLLTMYHGTTNGGFTIFDPSQSDDGTSLFFTSSLANATSYSGVEGLEAEGNAQNYAVYLNLTNPLIIDADGSQWDEIRFNTPERVQARKDIDAKWKQMQSMEHGSAERNALFDELNDLEDEYESSDEWGGYARDTREIAQWANERGYDGVIFHNLHDYGGEADVEIEPATVAIAFSAEQIKSADNKKPTDDPDIRFSLKEQSDLLKENAKLKEVNQGLREQFKVTKFAKVDKKSLDKFTKKLLKDYQSDVDVEEAREALNDLYTYIANGEDGHAAVWEEAYNRAYNTAEKILENASDLDDHLYQAYKELRDDMRRIGVKLDKAYERSFMGYADLNEFRKANFGKIKITNDGIPVDVMYADLAYRYPEFFDEERYTTQPDKLEHIAEVLDSLQPVEVNPFSYDMRDAATWLANDIMERFYELPQAKPTFADRAQQKYTKRVISDAKKLQKLRDAKNERIAQIIKQERARVAEVREKEREKRYEAVQRTKDYYLGKEASNSDKRNRAVLRKRIVKHVNDLSAKLVHPTNKKHVPKDMRKTVAAVLDAINLESQYTIDPVTGKRQKSDLGDPVRRTEAFRKLKEQYAKILQQEGADMVIDPSLFGSPVDGVTGNFDKLLGMSDVKLADMSYKQLETVWHVIRSVEHSISTAGKMLASQKFARTVEWADAFVDDTATRRRLKGNKLEALRLDMENPYTFFSHYGEAGQAVFRMLRDAQDAQQNMVDKISEEVRKIVTPKQVKAWEKEVHEFTTERGDKLTLTAAHMMEIRELMKREQSHDHLLTGGIVQPEVKAKRINKGTESILLTYGDLLQIVGKLTPEQREVADSLQALTNTILAKYGNDAHMKVYGYKKFTEPNYWPIKSSELAVHRNPENSGNNSRSIKNIGLAKDIVPHANNALDIGGVFNTFSNHAADMIDYAAWLAPMEDANRLYNFTFRDDAGKPTGQYISGMLDSYGGKGAHKYWERLMEDIQNGINRPADTLVEQFINKVVGNARAAAVGANIRVIIQQPTSFLRAAIVLNPADMTKGLTKGVTGGSGWKKALKYSEIARRKNMGGFDISNAQMNETMFDSQTKLQKFNEAMMWGAAKADALTWGKIWNACEWSVKRNNENLAAGSKEFYDEVSALFTEVVDQSQVVDGVLQRSQLMRSANTINKQATAFMGEPTMVVNMLLRAYDNMVNEQDATKRSKAIQAFGRAASALLFTTVVNAAAQSIVDAMRDDEDEEYWDRFVSAFTGWDEEKESLWDKATTAVLTGNLGSGVNPLGYVPYFKDLVSMAKGYNVTRADADVMGDILSASKNFASSVGGDGKKTLPNATFNLAKQVSKVFGISAGNLSRDVYGLLRTIAYETGNVAAQYEMEKWIYNTSNDGNANRFVDILYRAYNEEDPNVYRHIYNDMKKLGIDPEKIQKRMETNMKKDQGVTEVKDLEQRYLAPEQQGVYDNKLRSIKSNSVWKNATEEQRSSLESSLYDLVAKNNNGIELSKDIDAGRGFDLDDTEYLLYQLALDMVDQPNGSGKYGGAPTNAEKAAAVELYDNLGDKEIAYLWGTDEALEALAAGIDMEVYAAFKGFESTTKADKDENGKTISGSKKEKIRRYLNENNVGLEAYNYFMYDVMKYK